jgi:hypothetical protein
LSEEKNSRGVHRSDGAIEIVIGEPVVKIKNYADDVVFIITATNADTMNISLAGAMGRTTGWYKENGFQINADKCFFTMTN